MRPPPDGPVIAGTSTYACAVEPECVRRSKDFGFGPVGATLSPAAAPVPVWIVHVSASEAPFVPEPQVAARTIAGDNTTAELMAVAACVSLTPDAFTTVKVVAVDAVITNVPLFPALVNPAIVTLAFTQAFDAAPDVDAKV